MRKVYCIAAVVIALAILLIPIYAQERDPENLLQNPGFERPYMERTTQIIVAHDWEWAYWDRYLPPDVDGGSSGPITRPEYKEAPARIDPDRVIEGDSAQCWFWMFAVGDAVVYQTVAVEHGAYYQADGSAASWVTNGGDPDADGEMYFSVGIDPYGGVFPWRTGVLWGPLAWAGHDHRRIYSPVVQAKADRITVFYRAVGKWALKHNDAYWDDAHLYRIELGEGTPATPYPTSTPYPCPTCPPDGGCEIEIDYGRIEQIVEDVLARLAFGVIGGR